MIKILEEVASQRMRLNKENFTIQLSSLLMKKAIDDVNKTIGENILKQNEIIIEFKYVMFGEEFTIKNRAYRDDTNDEDVEEVIYKFACEKQ
jgi:hypothetical protein